MPVSCRPVLPARAQFPWILGGGSLALLVYAVLNGSNTLLLIGGLGLAATTIGFVLPRLLLPPTSETGHDRADDQDVP